jgi:protein gp37
MSQTKIEYLDHVYNPLAMRCTPISVGCAKCWHLRMANRLAGRNKESYFKEINAYNGSGPPVMTPRLNDPLKRKKPTVYGVQFMGDWMHESINPDHLRAILDVIIRCPQHTFLTLTKRPERLNNLIISRIENLWTGVTVCNQSEADEKIPILLNIPAAHRWVSVEPILGPVIIQEHYFKGISWVVCGCETGPGARNSYYKWYRSLRDDCKEAGIPYFQKRTTGPTPDDLTIRELPF